MNGSIRTGAIFFSGQYGSTAQYARWIGDATGLPVFDINDITADPSGYDFLILGSSVVIYKLTIRKWLKSRLSSIRNKPVLLFTVSGAPASEKLDKWVADSVPQNFRSAMKHVALRGRMKPYQLTWWHRLLLRVGSWASSDPEVKQQELAGFDFMDQSSIEPIVSWVQQIRAGAVKTS